MLDTVCLLLQLSGDVEQNPGPTVKELLAQVLENQTQMTRELSAIKENQNHAEDKVQQLNEKLAAVEEKMSVLETTANQFPAHQHKISLFENLVAKMDDRIDDLENRSRRNNIIVYDVPEAANETAESLQSQVVNGIFGEKLGVCITSTERLHRIGKRTAHRPRPVIVKLFNFSEKTLIFKNCRKLKGSSISVSEDFSERVRGIRKNLWNSAAENRTRGDKVNLVYDKLEINNTLFVWDFERQTR
ncbi:unnamed protein product, partial [Ixodes pacificus]